MLTMGNIVPLALVFIPVLTTLLNWQNFWNALESVAIILIWCKLSLEGGRADLVWKVLFEQLAEWILFFNIWIFQAMSYWSAPPATSFIMWPPHPHALQLYWPFCSAYSPSSLPPQGHWHILFLLHGMFFLFLFISLTPSHSPSPNSIIASSEGHTWPSA